MKTQGIFLSEGAMRAATVAAVACGISYLAISYVLGQWTILYSFDKVVQITLAIALLLSFSRFKWDFMRGLMGAMLFALLYQEAFHVLGEFWGETADFDQYLIMGVQGSLYLAVATMSFVTTAIITTNHFILEHGRAGNRLNMAFNQLLILFKVALYVMLLVLNGTLDLPSGQLICTGIEYVSDIAIVVMVICVESQLDDFKEMRRDLQAHKKTRERHE